ncbi:3-hydroxyacyl-CoA dehydrogenase NAD-binding domain-containing protein [Sphingosinicella microcystinivorans]|uniref:3-hydroxyacyl-CoA dehydrogenase n=1 Tax=Sphingosinicella microcystinivorans TaxID=335406 RepID=A0AAD1G1R9_SPHMI|nr:3-hydroxyacyl-CoA dehydrogenase NAD-binding domain-containing protein [Sphingosinicella microcystinivorans]RKS92165.1 short chain enoyl-CoA hydratase /3-hydroxyacyl-CoA dehydrogenase [Sphingosinicella microcystinivorans]BBE35187.1 3-hydroxyacyl-CoA dehydrogenase [Sphingosinicella microcystinivorans]
MTAINDVVDLSRDGEIAVITVNSPPVNALSAPVRDGIATGVTSAVSDPDVKAIVLICAGRTFIAGADITEFGKPPRGTSLHQMIDVIESATKPVIAAIHGTALGGGLETALGAHYRVAVPSAKLGLPEVKLGLLPGAGGTQRLPRVVGAEAALKMVTSGNPIGAKAALDSGLVDELVDEADLRGGAIAFAQKVVAENRPLKKIRDRSVTADPALFAEFRAANARKFRGFDAPEANIKCIEAAVTLPFEGGMKRERELFMGLMTGTQSAAQRHIFFAERQAARIKDLPEGTTPRPIKSVGVIGAGTMGGGISMNFLSAGIPVTIVETNPEALERGVGIMRKNYEASAAKGALKPEAVEANMGRLSPTLDLEALKDCDLIIEAVFEDMAIKKEIFAKLDRIAKPGAILASNTSYLDVDEIASATSRPQDVVGLHFFSPANVMKLLEVVRGAKTAPDVLATAMGLAKTIGKVAVVAGVCFGFIGNRMLRARQDQAQALILEGAMPWDVDRVLYDFGFPMGPFQMADLAGLDIGWNAATSKGETVRDRLCEAGKRGQKTGSGFYDYDEKRNRTPSKVAEEIILAKSAELGITRRQISDEEILERCIYPMINEGAKILEEGIAQRPSDIDVAWIYGYGFPVYRGGPMFYGDTVGLKAVLDGLQKYEKVHGSAFAPATLLARLAGEGKSFRDLN